MGPHAETQAASVSEMVDDHLYGSSPLNDPKQHDNECNDQQNMNKITQRIAAHHPQQPQNDQYAG
jgi:hypothetical protein